jgi:cullin-associated NEDD8-dissociated protein 1
MDLLEYDPNYTYDDNEDMQQEDEMEDWGSDFAEDEQEAMHDDDDTSWKVRRSAIKIIDATIKTRPEFVKTIVNNYSLRLVSRFKERIDDFKCDLLDIFRDLLALSVESGPAKVENELRHQSSISREKSYNSQIQDASAKIIKALIK